MYRKLRRDCPIPVRQAVPLRSVLGNSPGCTKAVKVPGRTVIVALNESGRRIGATHHNATISDAVVDQIRDRHENDGLGYVALAREFNLSKNTVRKICTYERRAQTPARYIRMRVVKRG